MAAVTASVIAKFPIVLLGWKRKNITMQYSEWIRKAEKK